MSNYQSVVRIFATSQSPNYDCPWQRDSPSRSTGSGVVIAPGAVITGAHVIADGNFLQVQKVSDPNKFTAQVEAVCHDCDLALLRVPDNSFMTGIDCADLGELPNLRDRVSVVGYPVGGEEISITEGVVSRIEIQRYSHSERRLLAATVDAAINDGNSGGPVFLGDHVVGIAFQTLRDAENIGEMVPSNLIRRFLEGTAKGRPPEIPGLGVVVQKLENPQLRQSAQLPASHSGVLVVAIPEGNSAEHVLELGDVITEIEGHPVANNGTLQYAGRYRTAFSALLGDKYIGDALGLTVYRKGKPQQLELSLKPHRALVPPSQYDTTPSYFIWAGLVFQPLSLDLLRTWNTWWERAPSELRYHYYHGLRTHERQQVIVLTQVLADEVNIGYERYHDATVSSVNGQAPRDLPHFVELLEKCEGEAEIRLSNACRIVINSTAARQQGPAILEHYGVPRDRSKDLVAVRASRAEPPKGSDSA
jgi:S1-C subfamily serine protease